VGSDNEPFLSLQQIANHQLLKVRVNATLSIYVFVRHFKNSCDVQALASHRRRSIVGSMYSLLATGVLQREKLEHPFLLQ
jgi:hypothetical protein